MTMTHSLRTTAIVLSLAALPLAACTTTTAQSGPAQAAAATQEKAIPFTAASAELLPDGSGYRVSWQAPDAGKVRIFAGTDPNGGTTGTPVAEGLTNGSVTVPGIGPVPRPYFTLVPERGLPLVVSDRGLHLSTVPNWRDIGGYRTSDGQWVAMGKIYRADQLDRVNDTDLARIADLDTAVVIDLRTNSERTREPDRLPPNARGLVLDVAADSSGSLGGDMREAMAAIASGKGAEMLTAANRDFVSLPSAQKAYAAMLRELLNEDKGAVVYHCTAGKDRTGWATAVILSLLGVPRETITADYLLSNAYLKEKNAATAAMFKKSGAPFDVFYLEPVMTVRPEYLQAAFDEVERKYGSMDAYIRQGLGLTDAEIAGLKQKYLTGSAG